jgi:[FeFe] hydrogenase (group B1/B3)
MFNSFTLSGMTNMFIENKTTLICREILTRVAQLVFNDRLVAGIDKIPLQMIPRDAHPFRCCLFKDRELIKQRTIVVLGFSPENEAEMDDYRLSDYAQMALERVKPAFPILTFLNEACKACVRANYFVTNVCHNCVARPCMVNCPKQAISSETQQAYIHPEKCINCGICMKVCPFHAIVYVPVPCEEACPVGAISKDEHGKEVIDYRKCIFCGKCSRACPFGAVMDKSQILDVLKHLQRGTRIAAMIAPSIVGQFTATLPQIVSALKTLGFTYVVEVALGADKTAEIESAEFVERMQRGDKLMGTSCCPAYMEAVKKHAQAFTPYVSQAKTPMAYTAEMVKATFPEAIRVFIGPCVAKKHEGLFNAEIDYVLTFEELSSLFDARGIVVEQGDTNVELDIRPATKIGRGFPVSGGVAHAISVKAQGTVEVKPVYINGFTRQNVKWLNVYARKCPGNLVEVMSCEGGCIGGPGVINKPQAAAQQVADFLEQTQPLTEGSANQK